jgi:hypothetical protein
MINYKKIANSVFDKIKRKIFANAEITRFNNMLIELAKEHEINLPKNTNLMNLAFKAAKDAGAKDYYEHIAIDAVHRLIFPNLTDEEKKFDYKYLKFQMLPVAVINLKSKGLSFEQITDNDWIVSLSKEYNIPDLSYLKKFYDGEKTPTKKISPEKVMQGKRIRDAIFKSYNPSIGSFTKFWYTATKNMALKILEKTNKTEDALNNAVRIISRDDDSFDGVREDKLFQDESSHTKNEAKAIKKELYQEVKKLNPLYEKALNLIADGFDPFAKADHKKFMNELNLDEKKFSDFVQYFIKDLAKIFKKLELESFDDAREILVAKKKIASKILLRLG